VPAPQADVPVDCLKYGVLSGLADAIVAWLDDGGNVYLHCHEGVSRVSYIDIAVHCRALGISASDALIRIRAKRPIADPNPGPAPAPMDHSEGWCDA
jgi:protein-tyrosine phosphatase